QDPAAHHELGILNYHVGDKNRALTHFQRAADLAPNSPRIRRNLNLVYSELVTSLMADLGGKNEHLRNLGIHVKNLEADNQRLEADRGQLAAHATTLERHFQRSDRQRQRLERERENLMSERGHLLRERDGFLRERQRLETAIESQCQQLTGF